MRTLDRRLFRTISRSRLQYAAIVVVIAMGLMSYALMVNTFQNMDHSLSEYYRRQAFPDLFASFSPQSPGYLEGLENLPEIRAAEGRLVNDVRADVGRDNNPVLRLISVREGQQLNLPFVHEGTLPGTGDRGIALLARFASANDISIGDDVDLVVRGELVRVTVTAVVDSPEYIYAIRDVQALIPDDANFGVGYADLSFMGELLGMPGQVNGAVFVVHEGVDREDARDAIEDRMEGRGLKEVTLRDDQLSNFMISLELEMLEQFSQVVPVIFLSIAAAIIYMLISRLVKGDRTTIGILKGMGYADREILGHYLKYALLLGLLGAVIGMALGFLGVAPMSEMYMEFFELPLLEGRTDWSLAIWGIILTMAFCAGTGLLAAREVLQIAPADAMRPPAPPPGQKNILETATPRLWEGLTFGWKLVLRNIFRNKQRFALALIGVALTFTVIFMPFYMLSVIDVMFFKQYGELEVYDYSISFDVPVGEPGITGIGEKVAADAVEPFLEFPFRLKSGWREETAPGRALPAGAKLQRFEDEHGRIIGVPHSGILVSNYLAGELGVGAGDDLVLTSYITGDREHRVTVAAVVNQYLGSGIYMSLDQMQRITGQGGTYSGALVQSPEDVREELEGAGNVIGVFSSGDIMDAFDDYLGLVIAAYSTLIIIGGILGFAILFNTASVSISERAREFSSMRVLGYGRHEIYRVLLRENILAWIAGMMVGAPLARGLSLFVAGTMQTEMFYLPPVVNPLSYLVTAALVTIFTGLVMVAVWVRVKNLNLLEALSSRLT